MRSYIMKKYIITTLVVATFTLAGCGGMSHHQMEMMKAHINDLQKQVDENAATAIRAQDMASEALMKSGHKGSSRHRMHRDRMMK